MATIHRRNFVLGAAAAAAAVGVARPIEVMPSALAQVAAGSPLNPKGLKFHKFKVGDLEVTSVLDGVVTRDHNPGFIRNASVDDLKGALRKANLPDGGIPNSYTVTIVKNGNRTIMFDSGNGPAGGAVTGELVANMQAAGIEPASLTAIVITHFHPDHIYGLLTKENGPIFANTEIVVPEAEMKFWADPGVIEKLPPPRQGIAKRVQASLTGWKNIKQIAPDTDVVPGVRAVATYGHAPGHTSYLMGSGASQLMVLGDVSILPAINMANPGWHVAFDQDGPAAEATRRKMFDRAVADKLVCAGFHWGMPGAGTVSKDGNGYAVVPIA